MLQIFRTIYSFCFIFLLAGTRANALAPSYPCSIGEFPFVGKIFYTQANNTVTFAGSGTVIDDRWVLTAAHVATNVSQGKYFQLDFIGAPLIQPTAIFHLWNPAPPGMPGEIGDLPPEACLMLFPPNTFSGPFPRFDSPELEIGEVVTLVGFGVTGVPVVNDPARLLLQGPNQVKRWGTNRVSAFDPLAWGNVLHQGIQIMFDFDGNSTDTYGDNYNDPDTTNEVVVAYGDSGGPSLRVTSSGYDVVGIHTSSSGLVNGHAVYGGKCEDLRVSKFAAWITYMINFYQ